MLYSTRQTSYLRIGPYAVLQMTIYLEEENVHWMSDSVLERVLLALKDRIPVKLNAELPKGGGKKGGAGGGDAPGKDKAKIDVFRGADFQIAYFFRKMAKSHGVLLKDKQLIEPTPRSPPPPHHQPVASTSNLNNPKKRAREDDGGEEGVLDLTEAGDDDHHGLPGEEGLVVKDEDVDITLDGFGDGDNSADAIDQEEEEKPDVKPKLKVNYTGYSIYNRSLIVIIEPYPPLTAAQKAIAKPRQPTEVRQLSASVGPSRYRETSSAAPNRTRTGGRGGGFRLFRSETTPLGDGEEEEVAEGRDVLRRGRGEVVVVDEEDEEEDLPTLDALLKRRGSERG